MPEKLVRDNIPELIRARGEQPRYRRAAVAERPELLLAKLAEECRELQVAYRDYWERTDEWRPFHWDAWTNELADVLEVVLAIAREGNVRPDELESIRAGRTALRGGFGMGIVLELDESKGGTDHA